MRFVGIDLHKVNSQICIIDGATGVVTEKRFATDAASFRRELSGEKAKLLLESATESEWVARLLEELGHEVVVADPNFAPMYATRSRKVKTDRRDALALADACQNGTYQAAHRVSDGKRLLRAHLRCRESLVRQRTQHINVVRATLRQWGLRVRSGEAGSFVERVRALEVPEVLLAANAPLLTMIEATNREIAGCEKLLAELSHTDETAQRLQTVPGVGVVTALTFLAALDTAERFQDARQVAMYLGLVPREYSSGEKQVRGAITKCGNARLRWLLVQAAWSVWRSKDPDAQALRDWAIQVANRRGRKTAIVGLARRLARILYAVWRDGTKYQPPRVASRRTEATMAT